MQQAHAEKISDFAAILMVCFSIKARRSHAEALMAMPKETHMSIQIGFSAQTKCSQTQEQTKWRSTFYDFLMVIDLTSICTLFLTPDSRDLQSLFFFIAFLLSISMPSAISTCLYFLSSIFWNDANQARDGTHLSCPLWCPGFGGCQIGAATERGLRSTHGPRARTTIHGDDDSPSPCSVR